MDHRHFLFALLTSMLVTVSWAQTPAKPLNLKLPPADLPASNATVAQSATPAPGVYYGDTSGRLGNAEVASDDRDDCDDSSHNRPEVHGSVGMGFMSGSHMHGSYQTGTVNLRKAFGDCDRPRGGVSISIGTGRFDGRRDR